MHHVPLSSAAVAVVRCALGVFWLAAGLWGTLTWLHAGPGGQLSRSILGGMFACSCLAGLIAPTRWRWRARCFFAAALVLLLPWWQSLRPSNTRDWQTDVAVLPWASQDGDRITVHNVRNFRYRSETDYDVAYEDRSYDLSRLERVDLAAVYWMGPHIAHVMLSFGFAEGGHLAFSIETRKEQGEKYDTLAGFFRQYEEIFIAADERDLIGVRAIHRHDPPEQVYLYRLQIPRENIRRLFLAYLDRINRLKEKPSWYNTLSSNCTTNIWMLARVNQNRPPMSWKILASGHVPEFLYQRNALNRTLPLPELHQAGLVNERAQAAGNGADFSRRIREGIP